MKALLEFRQKENILMSAISNKNWSCIE